MSIKLKLDFEKRTKSGGVIDIFSNGLLDDPDKDVLLPSLKECLAKLTKGNKLPYMAANYLLINILNTLALEDGDIRDEITDVNPSSSQVEEFPLGGLDETIQGSSDGATGSGNSTANPAQDPELETGKSKKKETCRFYTRGHCEKKKDCRFEHPLVCQKFRQYGSLSTDRNGCNGKCGEFHPNACRSSLKDRTCSWRECRFYHLKGTKSIYISQRGGQNLPQNGNRNNNGNQNNNQNNQNRNINQNKNQNGKFSQNSNQNQYQNNKKKNQNQNQNQNNNRFEALNTINNDNNRVNRPPSGTNSRNKKQQQVFHEDRLKLSSTLEAIMQRLSAMETKQASFPLPPMQMNMLNPASQAHQIGPMLSPAVPQLGTVTQQQWASQNLWPQSQSQSQF